MLRTSTFVLLSLFLVITASAQEYNLLIGTYTTKSSSEGIYVYHFDGKKGEAKLRSVTKNVVNPSYLAASTNGDFIYSVNEYGKNSAISAFKFDSRNGNLLFLNKRNSVGGDPCFITTFNHQLLVANYSGGSIGSFFTDQYGKIADHYQLIKHTGKSVHPTRQTSAHVHQVQITPDKKFAIVTDLGEDKIYLYDLGKEANHSLSLKNSYNTEPGSGPRHIAFSPNGKFAYLANEFTGNIVAYQYNAGNLTKIQEIPTVTKGFSGKIDGADIHVSPDGKFLYETNRGDANTINLFSIGKDGELSFVESVSTLGKGPRNFSIDPSGHFLLVAHQYTNNVVIFERDIDTGKLKDTGNRIEVGSPVCLLFTK